MIKYLLHINEACHEDWDTMTPDQQGRFCAGCNKNVIDLTAASDKDIINYLKTTSGNNFCGKFETSQLDRWMFENDIKKSDPALYKLILGVLLFTASQNINAQKTATQYPVISMHEKDTGMFSTIKQDPVAYNKNVTKVDSVKTFRMGAVSSITNNTPLIVIDKNILRNIDLSGLDANRIKDIKVLKGPDALAVYGKNAEYGVIVITTDLTDKQRKHLLSNKK